MSHYTPPDTLQEAVDKALLQIEKEALDLRCQGKRIKSHLHTAEAYGMEKALSILRKALFGSGPV